MTGLPSSGLQGMSAPQQPMATPKPFFHVMGSFKIKNDNIMAKMGIEVVTMLALTGEVMLKPILNRHWLNTIPSKPAPANFKMSFAGICSRGPTNDANQNNTAAPATRNDTTETPSKPLFIADLAMGDINPQMTSAVNILR